MTHLRVLRRTIVVAATGAEILPVSGAHGASPWLLCHETSRVATVTRTARPVSVQRHK
jgi:hypothetical protein